MGSLAAHLCRPENHGRLAYHPECPICRDQRLAGTLAPDVVVGRRTQAVLAAGVLALSSATPTAVLAAEPDQEQEGATAPEQVVAAEPPSDSGFDPGGQPNDLPFNTAPAPLVPSDPAADAGPIEQEPATNEDAPTADQGDGSGTPPAPETADPVAAPPAAAPPAPQAPTEVPPTAATPEPAVATPVEPDADPTAPPRDQEREAAPERRPRDHSTAPALTVPAVPAPQSMPVYAAAGASAPATVQVAQAQPTASSTATTKGGRAAQRGDRVHVVRRGESLWSIASDLVGDGASPARVAREVNRLWELNSVRIGTGDPDLLMADTRLTLR